jgi:hypothetical protein
MVAKLFRAADAQEGQESCTPLARTGQGSQDHRAARRSSAMVDAVCTLVGISNWDEEP